MKLMMDLIVLAFRMDKTRIATCMLNNDLSQMNFGFLASLMTSGIPSASAIIKRTAPIGMTDCVKRVGT